MNRYSGSPARYRYEDRFLFIVMPLLALVGILMWGSVHFHWNPVGVLAVACAAVVCLPFCAMYVIVGLYLAEEEDDFQKSIVVRSMLWGIGVTLMATTFWGALEIFAHVPSIDVHWVQFVFFPSFGVAALVGRWRYR